MKRVLLFAALAAVAAAVVLVLVTLVPFRADRVPRQPGTSADAEPRFRFAVISDLHGGMREGSTIPAEAVDEINLLDPDFTISVGDLIYGYTDDASVVNRQWDEFDALVGRLKRPFYYVFGNHDATNPTLTEIIRRRYGPPYYSFDHGRCHFIVLFTESRDEAGRAVNLEADTVQMDWLKKDLAASTDALHTFVFFHQPVMSAGFLAMFEGRPTTIFTGHWHKYQQFEREGVNYHVLGSTGAGMNGDTYGGSLYHTVLVSVSGRTVTTAIVRVGAILPDTLLSADRLKKIARARANVRRLSIRIPPDAGDVELPLELTVPNPLPMPVRVTCRWELPADSPWSITPAEAEFVVAADAEKPVSFTVVLKGGPDTEEAKRLPQLQLRALGGRALTSHRPDDRGLDTLYDYVIPLTVERPD